MGRKILAAMGLAIMALIGGVIGSLMAHAVVGGIQWEQLIKLLWKKTSTIVPF